VAALADDCAAFRVAGLTSQRPGWFALAVGKKERLNQRHRLINSCRDLLLPRWGKYKMDGLDRPRVREARTWAVGSYAVGAKTRVTPSVQDQLAQHC
jgi:hypothetical protein